MTTYDYKAAGVDIAAGNEAVRRIKRHVESTFSPRVLTGLGSFGALYDLKALCSEYQHPVLVQSIDGVGTKMMVARLMEQYDTIGIDLVSACVNDIVVLGAKPLTFLDYIANDHLQPAIIEQIVAGMCQACKENDIALVGGETAEMPDTYLPGEHDLVGVITGIVEKDRAILGNKIAVGDLVMALPASGLHTNGYSLARKLLFNVAQYTVHSRVPELAETVGETLLKPHLNYTQPVQALLGQHVEIKGMAHITGGGLLENIPRILPPGMAVELQLAAIPTLPIFALLQRLGQLSAAEMYRTFNMGVGLVVIVAASEAAKLRAVLQAFPLFPCYQIGTVIPGQQTVRLS